MASQHQCADYRNGFPCRHVETRQALIFETGADHSTGVYDVASCNARLRDAIRGFGDEFAMRYPGNTVPS